MPDGKVGKLYEDLDGNYISEELFFERGYDKYTPNSGEDTKPATNEELKKLEVMDRVVKGELKEPLLSHISIVVKLDEYQDMISNPKLEYKIKINKDYEFVVRIAKK